MCARKYSSDAPEAVSKLRKKSKAPTTVQRVYEDYSTCARRRVSTKQMSSKPRLMFNCDMEQGHMMGQFVTFVAPSKCLFWGQILGICSRSPRLDCSVKELLVVFTYV